MYDFKYNMSIEQINEELFYKLNPDGCYHDWDDKRFFLSNLCRKKGCWAVKGIHDRPDYFTAEGFFLLMDFLSSMDLWRDFDYWVRGYFRDKNFILWLCDVSMFPYRVHKFLMVVIK